MSNGAAVRRASDDPEDPEQKDESMTSSTVATDQRIEAMHGQATVPLERVPANTSESDRASVKQISGKEIFLRALPTIACLAVVLSALAVRPGVFWGTALVAVLVVLMIVSIVAWIPKTHSR